jgi:hypothetical protein
MAPGLTALSIGMSLQSDVVVQVKVQAKDTDTATALAKQAQSAIDYGKSLLSQAGLTGLASSLTATTDDTVVEVDADLPGSELGDFVKLLGSFI